MSPDPIEDLREELPDHLDDDEAPAPTGRVGRPSALRFARMAGSSIAARDAAPWITDFLNAAYYRRDPGQREVDDLRLAFTIVTTYWEANARAPGRRLHVTDLAAFHRAFGAARLEGARAARGTLDRAGLLEGGARLLGDWLPEAYGDDARRAWGIAFPTRAARDAYDPGRRLRLARLGSLTPEGAPAAEQVWHLYAPVALPSAARAIAVLARPEGWPDLATEIGRFTPLRPGGLADQTFEIEVAAGAGVGLPFFTRGYVTITDVVTPDEPRGLTAWVDALEDGLARRAGGARGVPEGAQLLIGLDLTTHEGHFMGHGHNRLFVYEHEGRAWARAAGTWDPMPWHLARAYRAAGRDAQRAFWGEGDHPERSMLHQLALRTGA